MKLALLLALAAISSASTVGLTGVNLACAEFGSTTPGTYGTDYTYPTSSEFSYWKGKGANFIRMPFTWGRLQQSLGAEFDTSELSRLTTAVTGITSLGLAVMIEPHNYARYPASGGSVIGASGSTVTAAHFADFWTKLANVFKDNSLVVFGLMNEPNTMSSSLWFSDAQTAITAIRATGATNLLVVPGNGWTGGHSWLATWPDSDGTLSNAVGWKTLSDPASNMVVDIHQYLDSDYSGSSETCTSATVGSTALASFTSWARTNGYKAILSEFGSGTNTTCQSAVSDLLTYLESNNDVWLGWSWWAAGPWWGEYIFTVEPTSAGADRTQTAWLVAHFSSKTATEVLSGTATSDTTSVTTVSSDITVVAGSSDITVDTGSTAGTGAASTWTLSFGILALSAIVSF